MNAQSGFRQTGSLILPKTFMWPRGVRLAHELAVAEEIDGVRGDVDGDDRAAARRVIGQTFDLRRLIAFAEDLPPMTGRLLLLCDCRDCCDCQARDEQGARELRRNL